MIEDFALDLKVARRKSGLTQSDCAHLLGRSASKVSALERGTRMPSLKEMCALSLIYRKSFESLFGGLMRDVRQELSDNLKTLPCPPQNSIAAFNRKNTLAALADHLSVDNQTSSGS